MKQPTHTYVHDVLEELPVSETPKIAKQDKPVRMTVERHSMGDGTYVWNVVIRWDGGDLEISAENEDHARRIYGEIRDAVQTTVTVWES